MNFEDYQTEMAQFEAHKNELQMNPELYQQEQDEELGFWGTVGDIGMAIPRGIAGAAEGVLELGNVIPGVEYDIAANLGMGESESIGGSAIEGITQFLAGFAAPGIGGLAWAGRIGKIAGMSSKVQAAALNAHRAKNNLTALALSRGSVNAIKYGTAGAIADFSVFDGHEHRLSNLIQSIPGLENPVSEFFAASEDDSELEGRLKAAVEGLGLGFAFDGLLIGLRAIKAGRAGLPDKKVAEQAAKARVKELSKAADEGTAKAEAEVVEGLAKGTDEGTAKAADDVATKGTDESAIKTADEGTEKAADDAAKDLDLRGEIESMSKLSKEELEEIRSNTAINWNKASTEPEVRRLLQTVTASNAALRKLDGEVLDDTQLIKETQKAYEQLHEGLGIPAGTSEKSLRELLDKTPEKAQAVRDGYEFALILRDEVAVRGKALLDEGAKAISSEGTRLDLAQYVLSKRGINQLEEGVKILGQEFARGLRSFGIAPPVLRRELEGITTDSLTDGKLVNDIIDMAGGADAIKADIEKMLAAADGDGLRGLGYVRGRSTWFGATIEYWMNSILSGPVTNAVNVTSAGLTTLMAPLEKALGRAAQGNLRGSAAELKRYGYLISSIADSLKMAGLAARHNEGFVDPRHMTLENTTSRSVITDKLLSTKLNNHTAGRWSAEWLGKLVNLPSRFLTTGDEFFKQLNYRSVMKAELVEKAAREGIQGPRAIAEFVEYNFKNMVTDGQTKAVREFHNQAKNLEEVIQRFPGSKAAKRAERVLELRAAGKTDEAKLAETAWIRKQVSQYSSMSDKALATAREVTFTTPLKKHERGHLITFAKGASDLVNSSPGLRLVMPFVRTPANIIKYYLDRVPLMPKSGQTTALRQYRKQLNHADAAIRDEAIGRLMTGSLFMGGGLFLAMNGGITGGGPTDKNRRRMMEEAGWLPYSVKVGDSYVSYRRLDPFAMTFGMIADLTEIYLEGDDEIRTQSEDHIAALGMAISRNLASKTYLTGITKISDAFTRPEQKMQSYLRGLAGSFIPNAVTQLNRSFDDETKDVKNWIDTFRSRIPGFSEGVAPRRNMFGEPIHRKGFSGAVDWISPFDYSQTSSDPVTRELAQVGHAFGAPSSVKNGVELRDQVSSSGQSAYDRWLQLHGETKIKGRTLRQSLTRLMNSKYYKKLPYESIENVALSPRIKAIQKILSKYRAKAFVEMLHEYPNVQEQHQLFNLMKQAQYTGRSLDELSALANAF